MISARSRFYGGALVLGSCLAIQGSAAISSSLFETLSPAAVAGWRQLIGALVLVAIIRPTLQGRSGREWALILLLGAAMAGMNVAFYSAVEVLPLGVAATLLYLGPFAIAAIGLRRGRHIVLPIAALIGVLMVSRPGGLDDSTGLVIGLLAGVALGTYTLTSHRLGHEAGVDTLALAVATSALLLAPFSVSTTAAVDVHQWWILLASGTVGVAAAFWLDFTALRMIGSQTVSVLFALDPVVGAVVGALLLGQVLDAMTVMGILVIVTAGAFTVKTVGATRNLHSYKASESR